MSCEFGHFRSDDTYDGFDDPFSQVQEYVLMRPDGKGCMEVRGVACEGGGFATLSAELFSFEALVSRLDAGLDAIDPRGASTATSSRAPALPRDPTDARRAIEATMARTLEASGAALASPALGVRLVDHPALAAGCALLAAGEVHDTTLAGRAWLGALRL